MTQHTVRSYDDELGQLTGLIARMGALAEAQLASALEALGNRDAELAARIVAADDQIDALEHEVQHLAVRLLALRQPMASDLRLIVAAIKMASGLERIGDYGANLAKRSRKLIRMPPVTVVPSVRELGALVCELLRGVLDAFATRDTALAVRMRNRDREVDERYSALIRAINGIMTDDPQTIPACTHLLFITKNLERIGDHATNIAESLHFLVQGTPLTDHRPKGGGPDHRPKDGAKE